MWRDCAAHREDFADEMGNILAKRVRLVVANNCA